MTARKHSSGWMADFYYARQRVRKYGFATKSAAVRYEQDYLAQRSATGRPLDDRLSDLVRLWHRLHGCMLKDEKARLARTLAVVERLGDPVACDFNALAWSHYRSTRLQKVSPHTVNHEQRYLSAVFSELIRLGAWAGTNPLSAVRQIRTDQVELTFLSLPQLQHLLEECKASQNNHCYPVALICASTGCRWNEAESLTRSCVYAGKVHFHKTKNSRSRAVPISAEVEKLILQNALPGGGRLFVSCRASFRGAYERCGFDTPGQLTHILRHTFASHFMMGGGDILTLQRILGHSDIKMTMRYSHLSPEHLISALSLSPLAQLKLG
ncbi:phage integrase [Halopseudomonas sabulinigri]